MQMIGVIGRQWDWLVSVQQVGVGVRLEGLWVTAFEVWWAIVAED